MPCPNNCLRPISTRPTALQNHLAVCGGAAQPRRKRTQGASKRQPYTYAFKWRVLRTYDELVELKKANGYMIEINPGQETADIFELSPSLVCKWAKAKTRAIIIKEAKANRTKRKQRQGSIRYKFGDVDKKVVADFKALRASRGAGWAAPSATEHESPISRKQPTADDADEAGHKAARLADDTVCCAYADACASVDRTGGLVQCTSRGCTASLHHFCFIKHFAAQAEGSQGKRLCPHCAERAAE